MEQQHQLSSLIDNGQFKEAITIINKILKNVEGSLEKDFLRAKVVLLVLLENFTEALTTFKESNLSLYELAFEIAYCQYRLGKYSSSLETISRVGNTTNDPRLVTLKAQILYRMNFFKESAELFERLIEEGGGEDKERIIINYIAANCCSLAISNFDTTLDKEKEKEKEKEKIFAANIYNNSYEAQFNYSCLQVARAEYEQAAKVIDNAIGWAHEALSTEGVEEKVINTDLCQYYLQKAFILTKTGRLIGARKVLENIPTDLEGFLSLLANFNKSIINGGVTDLLTRKHSIEMILNKVKPGSLQRNYALFNYALIAWKGERRPKTAARILRNLLKTVSLKRLATATLCKILNEIKSIEELKIRRMTCEYMEIADNLYKYSKKLECKRKDMDFSHCCSPSLIKSLKHPGILGVVLASQTSSPTTNIESILLPTTSSLKLDKGDFTPELIVPSLMHSFLNSDNQSLKSLIKVLEEFKSKLPTTNTIVDGKVEATIDFLSTIDNH